MILFTLRCEAEHEFEAWFRDGAAYDAQAAAGEIACPECGNTEVEKAPMAPRVARSARRANARPGAPDAAAGAPARRDPTATTSATNSPKRRARSTRARPSAAASMARRAMPSIEALAEEGIEVQRIPWVPPNDA